MFPLYRKGIVYFLIAFLVSVHFRVRLLSTLFHLGGLVITDQARRILSSCCDEFSALFRILCLLISV